MVAVAEERQHAGEDEAESIALPPGSLPIEAVRSVVRRHRAGVVGDRDLIAAVDRHGEALEAAIASKVAQHSGDFLRTVRQLERLHGWLALAIAQDAWLRRFPSSVAPAPARLKAPLRGRLVDVDELLDALSGVQLPDQLVKRGDGPRGDRRRGRAPSMVALAEAGHTVTSLALELGIDRGRAWRILNGEQPAPAGLLHALERLLGPVHAGQVVSGIPQHPRARAPRSAAVKAIHAYGASAEDLARLLGVQPGTARRYLRGTLTAPPGLGPALEQLLGGAHKANAILRLIPQTYDLARPALSTRSVSSTM